MSKHFREPDRCLSVSWIFRCGKPAGHDGEHLLGKTSWGRRAEDERHQQHELTQEDAWNAGAARVPEDTILDICEITNDGRPTGWPKFFDRTGEQWEETRERHDGDAVMMPGSDWVPMLRRDVQAFWGPLVTEEAYNEYIGAKSRLTLVNATEATDG